MGLPNESTRNEFFRYKFEPLIALIKLPNMPLETREEKMTGTLHVLSLRAPNRPTVRSTA